MDDRSVGFSPRLNRYVTDGVSQKPIKKRPCIEVSYFNDDLRLSPEVESKILKECIQAGTLSAMIVCKSAATIVDSTIRDSVSLKNENKGRDV